MHDSPRTKSARDKGFTLVELTVITPMIILLIGGLVGAMVVTIGEVIATHTKNSITYDIQDALNRIEHDVELSSRFLASTENSNFEISSPQGYNNNSSDLTNANSEYTSLLLLVPLTNRSPIDPEREIVYYPDSGSNCDNVNFIMSGVVSYFVKDNALWRRTIMPSDYASGGCSTPWQQPSCYPGVSGSFCETEDVKLVSDVGDDAFLIDYYTSANSSATLDTASDPSSSTGERQASLDEASTVRVQITSQKLAGSQDVSRTMSGYSTKLSTFSSDDPSGDPGGDPGGGDPGDGGSGPTTYFTENFPGSNGSSWNSSKWALGSNPSSSGWSTTIRDGRGRMISGSGGDWDSGLISRRIVMDQQADVNVSGTIEHTSYDSMVYIWVRSDANFNWSRGYGMYIDTYGFDVNCVEDTCSSALENSWTSYSMTPGTEYNFRFVVNGNRIKMRMWEAGDPEPTSWDFNAVDTDNSSPNPGHIGFLLGSGENTTLYLDNIVVTAPE